MTVLLAVRNAASDLAARVENLLSLDYPPDRLDILVICNGCADGSEGVAQALADHNSRVRLLVSPATAGKAGALNCGAAAAAGEILVFADVRQRFDPRAVRRLVRAFGSAAVGGVTGRLVIGSSDSPVVAGIGGYWALETRLRLAESRTGSVVGVTGAIHALRRDLFQPLPPALILDDLYLPLALIRQGWRIAMAPAAIAHDRPSAGYVQEYRRRVRTLVGNYEILRRLPWLISPVRNPIFVRYVSHKLLRLLTPLLVAFLIVGGALAPGLLYRTVALLLMAFLLLGAVGVFSSLRILAIPAAFFLLHWAGLSALLRPRRSAAELWG